MEKLRVGIIGVGFISKMHLEGYKKLDYVDIVAFCDIIPERAEIGAKEYGAPGAKVFTDYREMLAMKDLDAVSVCTENVVHAKITIAALQAGKHVLCEKPMAVTSKEAEAMAQAAKDSGKKLSVGYMLRFMDDAQLLRRLVDKDRLGQIYYAEAQSVRRRGVPTWGVFLDKAKQGGGPLIDIGTHNVDLTLWLANDYSPIKSVICRTSDRLIPLGGYNNGGHWDIEHFEVEDSAYGMVTFESGLTLLVNATWAINIENTKDGAVLYGTKGGAELSKGKLRVNVEDSDRLWSYIPESLQPDPENSIYDREIAAWCNCIINDTDPLVKPEQAVHVVRILEAMYESARTGKALNF